MIEDTSDADPEDAYEMVLPLLDTLPYEDQARVVVNWMKYVMVRWAESLTPPGVQSLIPAFSMLAVQFATTIVELPMRMAEELDLKPCGKCDKCTEEDVETTRESSVN